MLLHISKLPPVGLKLGQVQLAGLYQLTLLFVKAIAVFRGLKLADRFQFVATCSFYLFHPGMIGNSIQLVFKQVLHHLPHDGFLPFLPDLVRLIVAQVDSLNCSPAKAESGD
ncbi:MAG: hypothetical protein ACTH9A_05285, partial [Lactobacillus delbrueckii]